MLGEVALYCSVVLVVTGVFLTFFFEPSTREVVYAGLGKPEGGPARLVRGLAGGGLADHAAVGVPGRRLTLANVFFPGVLLPGITFALLYAWPFLEQRWTGDVAQKLDVGITTVTHTLQPWPSRCPWRRPLWPTGCAATCRAPTPRAPKNAIERDDPIGPYPSRLSIRHSYAVSRVFALVARVPKPVLGLLIAIVLIGALLVGIVVGNDNDSPHVVVGPPSTTSTVPPGAVPDEHAAPLTPVGPPVTAGLPAAPTSTTAAPGSARLPSATTTTTTTAPAGAITTTTTTTAPTTPTEPEPPKQFAYPSGPGEPVATRHVYVTNIDDGQLHSVLHDENVYDRAEWAPDGQRFMYALDNDTRDIFISNLDGTGKVRIGTTGFEAPTLSSQGDLALIDYDGTGHDLVIVRSTGEIVRIGHEDVGVVTGRVWSRDGSKVGFTANGRVWTADPDGTDVTPLTPEGGTAWKWLLFSPDGSRIAYQASERLWVVNVDGTGLLDLAAVNQDPSFDWSPDGTKLVVCAPFTASPRLGMSLVPADGSAPTALPSQGLEVSWSPDGATIAFKSFPFVNGATPLAVINADGTNRRVLASPSSGSGFGLGMDWAPDSKHLLVNTGYNGFGGADPP